MDKTLHEKLIEELFDDRQALSPRENAARNEIAALRKRLKENGEHKPAPSKVKQEDK